MLRHSLSYCEPTTNTRKGLLSCVYSRIAVIRCVIVRTMVLAHSAEESRSSLNCIRSMRRTREGACAEATRWLVSRAELGFRRRSRQAGSAPSPDSLLHTLSQLRELLQARQRTKE